MQHQRRILLENANNFRDLGGFATPDGTTAWGKLFRTESLKYLNDADWQKLRTLGVRTLFDLRSRKEAIDNPIRTPDDFIYRNMPLMQGSRRQTDDPGNASDRSGKDTFIASLLVPYSEIFADGLPAPADVLDQITDALEIGGVAFFCSAGKDRTGILTAAILTLCGVAREDIVADYMVTSVYNSAPERGVYPKLMRDMGLTDSCLLADILESKAETIADLLDYFAENDLRALLEENGFSREKQEKLIRKIVATENA